MPVRVIRFEPTPNPLAVKCVLDRAVGPTGDVAARSFRGGAGSAGHPLAAALLAVPGVEGVLFGPGGPQGAWVSVTRSAGVSWKAIQPAVERVLSAAEGA